VKKVVSANFRHAQVEELAGDAAVSYVTEQAAQKGKELLDKGKEQVTKSPDESINDQFTTFDNLANTLKSLGATNPELTNGESLFKYLGREEGYQGIINNKDSFFKLLNFIKETANKLAPLKDLDPSLADDLIKYSFNLLKQNAYNPDIVYSQLQNLSNKNLLYYDDYIVATLKSYDAGSSDPIKSSQAQKQAANSMILSLIGSFAENKGKLDSTTTAQLTQIGEVATVMFGSKSQPTLDAIAFTNERGKKAFQELSTSRDLWKAKIPITNEFNEIQSQTIKSVSGVFKNQNVQGVVQTILRPFTFIGAVYKGLEKAITG